MPWSIGLLIGESIIEMTGRADNAAPESGTQARALISNGSPENALQAFIQQNNIDQIDTVRVLTQSPLHWIENALGSPTAVLTTGGFENWLELNLPLKSAHFTSTLQRPPLLIDRELLFGVSERVNSEGHIEKLLDEKELEFLATKLELHQIKNVALCFLNSQKNSENERRACEYLKQKGLQVHTSSQHPSTDEKARFWSAILNAYISPLFIERLKKVQTALQKNTNESTQWYLGEHHFEDFLSGKTEPLTGALSLSQYIAQKFATTQPVLYCGLEDLWLFRPAQQKSQASSVLDIKTLGPVAALHQSYVELDPQPLTKLGRSFLSEVAFSNETGTFDPGPVLLGRGLTPTLFDLLGLKPQDAPLTGLQEKFTDRNRQRLREGLMAYAKNLTDDKNMSVETLTQQLLYLARAKWRPQFEDLQNVTLLGPLAPWIAGQPCLPTQGQIVGDEFFVVRSLLTPPHAGVKA